MPAFSSSIDDHWHHQTRRGDVVVDTERFTLTLDDELPANQLAIGLTFTSGAERVVVAPPLAAGLGDLSRYSSADEVTAALTATGHAWYGADYLFYLLVDEQQRLRREPPAADVRPLTADDAAAFADFAASVSEDERDEAFVELDHWAVVGAFDGAVLVSAASAYPWKRSVPVAGGEELADIGILTRPSHRGRGHGARVVRSMSAVVLERGLQPQYRCRLDHHASIGVAGAAGFAPFATWNTVLTGDDES